MEVGALEPEPPDGDVGPQQLQAAFELLQRAPYRPRQASGKGGKPGAPGRSESSDGPQGKGKGGQGGGGKGGSTFLGNCWKRQE
eukprot:14276806-Alexandrium_andersonii.AAC.1